MANINKIEVLGFIVKESQIRIDPFTGTTSSESIKFKKGRRRLRGHKGFTDPLHFASPESSTTQTHTDIDAELTQAREDFRILLDRKLSHPDKKRIDWDFVKKAISLGRVAHHPHTYIASELGFDMDSYVEIHTKFFGSGPEESGE